MCAARENQTEVDKLRLEIDGIVDEIAWLADSPIPPGELKQRIESTCKTLSDQFDLALQQLLSPNAGAYELGEILTLVAQVPMRPNEGVSHASIGLGGLLASLFGDDLVKLLCERAEDMSYTPGPPLKERPETLHKLREALRLLEKREEALICTAETQGLYIARRAEADPEIVLSYDPSGSSPDIGPRRIGRALPFENRPPMAAPPH